GVVQHAGRPGRARLSVERRSGKAGDRRRVSERIRAGDLRLDRALPRRARLRSHTVTARTGMIGFVLILALVVAFIWAFRTAPRWRPATRIVAAPSPTAPAPPGRKIKAHLFYVSESGTKLTGIE